MPGDVIDRFFRNQKEMPPDLRAEQRVFARVRPVKLQTNIAGAQDISGKSANTRGQIVEMVVSWIDDPDHVTNGIHYFAGDGRDFRKRYQCGRMGCIKTRLSDLTEDDDL